MLILIFSEWGKLNCSIDETVTNSTTQGLCRSRINGHKRVLLTTLTFKTESFP